MCNTNSKSIEYILRIAVFLTFFGHGYLALMANQRWIVYLETVGFSYESGLKIMPFIGVLDIIIAILILLKPNKYVVLWAVIWAFSAALIRPLSGEDIWSFIERGTNWGAPLGLYVLLKYKRNNQE